MESILSDVSKFEKWFKQWYVFELCCQSKKRIDIFWKRLLRETVRSQLDKQKQPPEVFYVKMCS